MTFGKIWPHARYAALQPSRFMVLDRNSFNVRSNAMKNAIDDVESIINGI
ncbi:hypothetical protein [Chromobacterium sinusclupearum]|nr:hypothetical protein [Chromobacterium sinusclupearum]